MCVTFNNEGCYTLERQWGFGSLPVIEICALELQPNDISKSFIFHASYLWTGDRSLICLFIPIYKYSVALKTKQTIKQTSLILLVPALICPKSRWWALLPNFGRCSVEPGGGLGHPRGSLSARAVAWLWLRSLLRVPGRGGLLPAEGGRRLLRPGASHWGGRHIAPTASR